MEEGGAPDYVKRRLRDFNPSFYRLFPPYNLSEANSTI
jgi:hypothetical protein